MMSPTLDNIQCTFKMAKLVSF